MPELIEVEVARRAAAEVLAGRTIVDAHVAADELVFDGVGADAFCDAVVGRAVASVDRKGKQMWWTFADGPPHVMVHFRMSGAYHIYDDASDRPDYLKLEVTTDAGRRLAVTNKRRFGRVLLSDAPEQEESIAKLGPDPLADLPASPWFYDQLENRRGAIKSLLINQKFLAGLGNWMGDEICYQAGIDPRREAGSLSQDEIKNLRAKIKYVVEKTLAWDADYDNFPTTWLFLHRWDKNNGDAQTHDGHSIEFTQVGGRTTAYVPAVQS